MGSCAIAGGIADTIGDHASNCVHDHASEFPRGKNAFSAYNYYCYDTFLFFFIFLLLLLLKHSQSVVQMTSERKV